jgi:hypothetical protein
MLEKTGYEEKGFDGVIVTMDGIHPTGYEPRKEYPIISSNQEEVILCKDWLKKYAWPLSRINKSHTSYYYKHVVEACVDRYISNGAFIQAAISQGYGYIISGGGPNCFFNIKYHVPVEKGKERPHSAEIGDVL